MVPMTREPAEDSGSRWVEVQAMQLAIDLVEYLRATVDALTRRITRDSDHADRQRVLEIIQKAPGIMKSRLLARSQMGLRRFDEIINTLTVANLIGERKQRTDKAGRPAIHYYAVRAK